MDNTLLAWLIVLGGFGGLSAIVWLYNVLDENSSLKKQNHDLNHEINQWLAYSNELKQREEQLEKNTKTFKQLFAERTRNFPLVGEIWASLSDIADTERERALRFKSRPSIKGAEQVAEIKREKRVLIKELTSWKYKAKNYEAIYPWLEEELASDIEDVLDADEYFAVYDETERADPVSEYVKPEDYRRLSISARNQLALDHYWQRGKKTKWMIGKMYERYVGYLYENSGWDVQYFGIHKRFDDLGRDLIAKKGNEIHVIQCKNWSQFKTIYENHIFQLFGTAFSMRKDNPRKNVVPVFYTSTSISETAAEFARLLGMQIYQNKKFESYPAIKCNISAEKEKIYHLPFDQQYDNIKMNKPGAFYAMTVSEAESAGFRRAYRWHGNKE